MAKKVTKKTATKKTATKKKAPTRKRAAAKVSANGADTATTPVSEARVRERAYEIYRSGRNASNPDLDWLQAEQELAAELS